MWNSDNAIFNVNGDSLDKLIKTLELAFNGKTVYGYKINEKLGIILYSYDSSSKKDITKFLIEHTPKQAAEIVFEWLKSDEASKVPCEGWDEDADHDGDNELGWRVYTEDWGHVDGDWNCLAIKPAYMWYGK